VKTSDELLERVFDLLESYEKEDFDVITIQALRHVVGSRAAFHARELVRDPAAVEVGS
jgi:hypothetical protein